MAEAEIQEPKKTRRASEYTEEIFTQICERMAEGEGLRKICSDPEMPDRKTILRWLEKDTGRQAKYARAREALMDFYSEEILTIAWDDSNDTIKGKDGQPLCNHEWIARSRLKVDTLKWTMSKLHPGRYGDKQQLELPPVEAPQVTISWQREMVEPVHDDDGRVIHAGDGPALRKRIIELEERLGLREGPPKPPKLLAYDPGPLPTRIDPEILERFLRMIKDTVPQADQRPPEAVLDEVLSECESALKARYGSDEAA